MPFKHRTKIQIRFKDIDALGHVNNANHLSYFESARIEYFNAAIKTNINWSQKGIILAKAEVNYVLPIQLTDDLWVLTTCSRIGNKSFDLMYKIVKMVDGKEIEVANGLTVMVCYDYISHNAIIMPEEWSNAIMNYEDGE